MVRTYLSSIDVPDESSNQINGQMQETLLENKDHADAVVLR